MGLGALFIDDGRFPKPDEYVGEDKFSIEGIANQVQDLQGGWSNIVLKSAIGKPAFCPKSERECDGSSWTARQTKENPITRLPVTESTVLLETHVVFEDNGKCESFISKWNGVCDSFSQLIPVLRFISGPDCNNLNRFRDVEDFPYSTNDEVRVALKGMV